MIYNIGKIDFAVNSSLNNLAAKALPLGHNLKKIWCGCWVEKGDRFTQQIRLDQALQICTDEKCKQWTEHTVVQVNLIAKEEAGEIKKHIYFAMDLDSYNRLEDCVIDHLQNWMNLLNQRLHRIWCQILAWNAQNLHLVTQNPNGDLLINTNIYGKIKVEKRPPIATAMFTLDPNKKAAMILARKANSLQKPRQENSNGHKSGTKVNGLRTTIFSPIIELTMQMWNEKNDKASATQPVPQLQESLKKEGCDNSWIASLNEAIYYILCKDELLPTDEELSTISGNLQKSIEDSQKKAGEDVSGTQVDFVTKIRNRFGVVELINDNPRHLQKASEYREKFFAVVCQLAIHVWEVQKSSQVHPKSSFAPLPTLQKSSTLSSISPLTPRAGGTDLVRKGSTDSNISSFMPSLTSSNSKMMLGHAPEAANVPPIGTDEMNRILDRIYAYYDLVLDGFRGIDGHGTRVTINFTRKHTMSAEWEQGKNRLFSCSVTLEDAAGGDVKKQIEEAAAYLIALALAGHLTDPAYTTLTKENAKVIEEIGTLHEISRTFFPGNLSHPVVGKVTTRQQVLTESYQEARAPSVVTCGIQRSLALLLTFMFEQRRKWSKFHEFDWIVLKNLSRKLKKQEDATQTTGQARRNAKLVELMGLDVEEEGGINISVNHKLESHHHDDKENAKKISGDVNYVFVEVLKAMSTDYSFTLSDYPKLIDVWFHAARKISLKETTLEGFAQKTLQIAANRSAILSVLIDAAWKKVGISVEGSASSSKVDPVKHREESAKYSSATHSLNESAKHSESDEKKQEYDEKQDY